MDRQKLRENRYTSFRYTSSWYTQWLVNSSSFLQHLRRSFGFARAESSKHVEHVNPYYTTLFYIWHFDILKQGTVFYEVGGEGEEGVVCADWGIWKDAYRLSPSLFPPFFAPPHSPRAWDRVLHGYFERNLDSADKFNRKQCDFMMTSHHVIVSIKLCLDVGYDKYIILLHSPWHAGPHLTPSYSNVTVAMNPCTLPYNVPISTSSKSYNLYGMLLLSSVQSPANTTTSL